MPIKPGYKTSEFYFSLAAIIMGAVATSGLLPDESGAMKIIGLVSSVLAAFGYTYSRGLVKSS